MPRVLVASTLILALAAQAPVPALAQPGRHPPSESRHDRWRPPPPGWTEPQWRYRQDYVRRHPDRRNDHSDAIIAGVLGFALGAAIAGSSQDKDRVEPRLNDPDWIAYCARKYRSFDPRSGTYLGRDGLRRYCQ